MASTRAWSWTGAAYRYLRGDDHAPGRPHDAQRSGRQRRIAARRPAPGPVRPGRHLHLSGYTLLNEGSRRAGRVALRLAQESGMSISVDCGSHAPLERVGAEAFLEWTNGVRLLFANQEQAAVLTGRDDPDAAAKVLTAWYPNIVIKLGADGALWASKARKARCTCPPSRWSLCRERSVLAMRSLPVSCRRGWRASTPRRR